MDGRLRIVFYSSVFGAFVFYIILFGFLFAKLVELKQDGFIVTNVDLDIDTFSKKSATEKERCTYLLTSDALHKLMDGIHHELSSWQNVSFSKNAYAFSAFWNSNSVTIVTLIVRGNMYNKSINYDCRFLNRFQYHSEPNGHILYANRKSMPENRGKRYSAAFFTCPIPKNTKPYAVSLSTDNCNTPSNILPIVYPRKQKRQFTVCVTPLNYKYSKAYELVEMIELNRILGADHFVFYNYSTDYNIDLVLQYYKKQGLVEVLEWNLPMKVDTWPKKNEPVEIHYFAQLAALNDCLYRNMHLSKYVVFQDLDEFIIPRNHLTWNEMLNNLPPDHGAYMFRCVFFRKEWPDVQDNFPGKDTARKYKMNTLLKQNREPKILSKSHRSKYIVNPRKIDTVGIHNIWRFRSGNAAYYVDPGFARMHHYRNWLNPSDVKTGIPDDRIMVFKDKLINNTINIWDKLKGVPLGPLEDSR